MNLTFAYLSEQLGGIVSRLTGTEKPWRKPSFLDQGLLRTILYLK